MDFSAFGKLSDSKVRYPGSKDQKQAELALQLKRNSGIPQALFRLKYNFLLGLFRKTLKSI